MSFFYLEVTKGAECGRRYALNDGAISIGRKPGNTVQFPDEDKSVSGHHAIIYKSEDYFRIQDLDSTNGTFINENEIKDGEINVGDEIGLGKTGPRAKLISSEEKLDTTAPEKKTSEPVGDSTEHAGNPKGNFKDRDSTYEEDFDAITKVKPKKPSQQNAYFSQSLTMEMEQKLKNNSINSDELHNLLNNEKRIEKILDQGSIGDSQATMLRTVYGANQKTRRRQLIILSAVIGFALVVIAFFVIRMLHYKQLLDQAQALRQEMDGYEKKIEQINKNPEMNKDELKNLISQLEEKQGKLASIKGQIDVDDFDKFYSDPLEQRIDEILMRFGEAEYHIPPEMVERVRYHIDIYSGRLHDLIGRYIKRKEKYFPMILRILEEKNLPLELAYVSMLESGFNPKALSHAGARGIWQFMPRTGRAYGLRVDEHVDERIIPEKATYAAAEYFKDLIGIFGGKSSVMLCMAAYNAGEGRVMGALRKIDDPLRDRDFWYIYRMGYLAEETNEYIPRVIALMIISEHPEEYGFGVEKVDEKSLETENDFVEFDHK